MKNVDLKNKKIEFNHNQNRFIFETCTGLFSPRYIDKGTLIMLDNIDFQKDDIVLDLGCGYGVVGIIAAKIISAEQIYMSDVNPIAVSYAVKNALRNGVEGVNIQISDVYESFGDMNFTKIICNPPYHTDFSVAKRIIEGAFYRLLPEGTLYLVTKRKEWYKRKCISVFGGVKIIEKDNYFVFKSYKKISLQ